MASGGDFARTNIKAEVPGEKPNPKLTKSVQEKGTSIGGTLHYTVKGESVSGKKLENVKFEDSIDTKNLTYCGVDEFKVKFHNKGKQGGVEDITDKCEITVDNEAKKFTVKGKGDYKIDLDAGEYVTIEYTGKVLKVNEAGEELDDDATDYMDKVENTVTMTGDNFDPLKSDAEVPIGTPPVDKKPEVPNTSEGKVIPYTATFENTDDEVWRDIVIKDEITTHNAYYNDDFEITINGKPLDLSSEASKPKYNEKKDEVTINTGKDIEKGDKIVVHYSITATNGEWIDNHIIFKTETKSALAKATVPPVEHEKDVKEKEHDGPDGIRNNLHYTITTKHNGKERPIKNPVIKDDVYSKNMTYGDINVYKAEGKAPGNVEVEEMKKLTEGEDYTIDISEEKMSFEIKLKDDLKPGDIVKTIYTGHVKDLKQVDNKTIFIADGVDQIIDDEHVPPPGDGEFFTVYKSSDPETDTRVEPGQTITYILKGVNTGDKVIKFGHIRDYIPEGTTFESVQNDGAFVKDKNNCEWVVKGIPVGGSKTVTFKVKVDKNPPKIIRKAN